MDYSPNPRPPPAIRIRAVSRAKVEAKDAAAAFVEDHNVERAFVDLTIKFIGASGLPKMDVVGSADPYFVAKLDDKLSFV